MQKKLSMLSIASEMGAQCNESLSEYTVAKDTVVSECSVTRSDTIWEFMLFGKILGFILHLEKIKPTLANILCFLCKFSLL